jgi:hypothetical protein
MAVAVHLVLLICFWGFLPSTASQGDAQQGMGYVVDINGATWQAANAGKIRDLKVGASLQAGDRLIAAGDSSATIDVVIFAQDALRTMKSGDSIPREPEAPSVWRRLLGALQRRLDNEALAPGMVRGNSLAADAALTFPHGTAWARLFPDLPAGTYAVQFRRLDASGAATGAWTASREIRVSATQAPMVTADGLTAGLWQVVIRDVENAGSRGAAWALLTGSAEQAATFEQMAASLRTSVDRSASLDSSATRIRRAALLELAGQASAR